MKELLKDKKFIIAGIVVILCIIGVILLRRRKKEESGFVMQRGFFPGGGSGMDSGTPVLVPSPTPTPTPTPAPDATTAPLPSDSARTMGTPPTGPTPPYPSWPVVPYYPAPVYYNPFPRTYEVVSQAPAPVNRGEYIDYLQKQINALELAYDDAMSNFMFGRAYKISGFINDMKDKLTAQLGY